MPTAVLKRTAKALRKHNGHRAKVASELGIHDRTLRDRIVQIKRRLPDEVVPDSLVHSGAQGLSADQIAETVRAVEVHGSQSAAALALGINRATVQNRLREAVRRSDWKPKGAVAALKARKMPLPKGEEIARYIVTCAQSGTKLHEPTWNAIRALAGYYGASLLVSTFSYSHRQEGSAKRGSAKGDTGTDWYDPRIEEFACDEMVALAPSLVFNGHMNILPTAVDPLSGMANYNGRASSIFPHAKVAMASIPTMTDSNAKLQYTTGACTQLNYIQKKAGQKAEFDHVYGGMIVEVNSDGNWWARQLHVDSKGRLYDLDVCVMTDGTVAPSIGATAIVHGDLHERQLDPQMVGAKWGPGGFVEVLCPDLQVAHDILDFESRSHHNRRDPHKMFALHVQKREDVLDEVMGVSRLLTIMTQHSRVIVADSNHDRHLERWLKEADWRSDPVNAEFYLDCQKAFLGAIRAGSSFHALKWAVTTNGPVKKVKFLEPGESYVVCRDRSGGVELGLHGDQGPGGARGSIRNLARIGRKLVIGHSHSAGIFNGAYQVGVSARLDMEYARGAPSSWTHTDCVVHPNGKRQMVTWFNGRWRA